MPVVNQQRETCRVNAVRAQKLAVHRASKRLVFRSVLLVRPSVVFLLLGRWRLSGRNVPREHKDGLERRREVANPRLCVQDDFIVLLRAFPVPVVLLMLDKHPFQLVRRPRTTPEFGPRTPFLRRLPASRDATRSPIANFGWRHCEAIMAIGAQDAHSGRIDDEPTLQIGCVDVGEIGPDDRRWEPVTELAARLLVATAVLPVWAWHPLIRVRLR